MKRKSNRLLSILLTMVMLLSILPTTAFAAETYTITFKDGGGSGTMDSVTVEAGTKYTLPECTFSNEGYEFKAWAYNSNVGEQLQPGTEITIRSNIRLYAVWQAKSFTITAVSEDENKGTVTGTGTYEYGTRASLAATPKEGYVFEGWYKDNVKQTHLSTASFYVSEDATYTAKFAKADDVITAANAVIDAPVAGATPDMTPEVPEADKDKYTVTFYKWYDSSYNEMSAEDTFEGGKKYDLRVVFEVKEGYKFEGTTFTVNGEATSDFTDDQPYSVTRRKIEFQVPAAATYPVTVENGKINISGGTSSGNYAPDSIVAIVANEPESGKQFKEWTATDGVSFSDATAAETSFRMPAKAVTVTATYEDIPAITYTVSFDANGGTGTMADKTGISGEYTLPANEFTAPSGKQFKAWSVGGVEKAAHEKISVTADTTVTALWEDIPVAPKTLDSIAITTPPTKTAYIAGESFDSTGMVVTATYSDSSTAPVTGYTVTPDGVLGISNTEITVTYTEDGVVKTATQAITVASAGGSGDSGSDDSGSDDTSTVTPSTPSVPEYVNPFTDVSEGDYFYDAVKWAVQNDITTGTTDTTFSPDMVCSRAQAVTFLYRAAGSPDAKGEMPFSDVAEDAYYHNAVLWAIEKGITKGISETEFAPDMVCTREQIVTFLYRAAVSLGKDVSVGEDTNILSYDDALDIGEWAIPAMQWACGAGVMNGTSESTLSPQMECTRGQIVTFLYRTFK